MDKDFFGRCIVALSVALTAHTSLAQQPQAARANADQLSIPGRVLPLPPKEILALLPATPANWKTTSSLATNQVGSWLFTIAQRQIEAPAANNPNATAPSSGPMRTTFMLIDTGYDPSASGAFVDFKPTQAGTTTKTFFRSYPIIRTQSSPTSESLMMLVNQRFMLRIETQNQAKDASLAWAQMIPFDRYNIPRTAVLATLPPEVVIASVDELNPSNNRESKTTIGQHKAATSR